MRKKFRAILQGSRFSGYLLPFAGGVERDPFRSFAPDPGNFSLGNRITDKTLHSCHHVTQALGLPGRGTWPPAGDLPPATWSPASWANLADESAASDRCRVLCLRCVQIWRTAAELPGLFRTNAQIYRHEIRPRKLNSSLLVGEQT